MSDLQCACTVLVAPLGLRDLSGRVRHRNVAAVYSSTSPPTVRAAQIVAAELGVGVTARTDLGVLVHGDGEGESAGPYALAEVLQEIADLHRGETVLVVGDGDVMPVELRVDGDGWVRSSWPSEG